MGAVTSLNIEDLEALVALLSIEEKASLMAGSDARFTGEAPALHVLDGWAVRDRREVRPPRLPSADALSHRAGRLVGPRPCAPCR